jgi:hypothetical protein
MPMERAYPTDPEAFYRIEKKSATLWKNDRYTVIVNPVFDEDGLDGLVWLSIRRNDRKAIRDWRDFQNIKNDLVGPEREALEIFPAESRLLDTANQYHMWVLPTGETVPFGFNRLDRRRVTTNADGEFMVDGRVLSDEEIDKMCADEGVDPSAMKRSVQRPRDDV